MAKVLKMSYRKIVPFLVISLLLSIVLSVGNAEASSDSDAKAYAMLFLEKVVGLKTDDLQNLTLRVNSGVTPLTNISSTTLEGRINYRNIDYIISMFFGKGIFYHFSMYPYIYSETFAPKVSLNDRLVIAKNALENYQASFNASHCVGFAQMVPASTQLSNSTLEEGNKALEITCYDSYRVSGELELRWYEKVGGFKIPALSTCIGVSETGLVVLFGDNLGRYTVGSTDVAVSEEEAIKTAMPYIENYSKEHNRNVISVSADLSYSVDSFALRGDSSAIYPTWLVAAWFDDIKTDIFGYAVLLWADTGEVYDNGAQGAFIDSNQGQPSYFLYVIAIVMVGVIFALSVILLRRRGEKTMFESKRKAILSTCSAISL